MADEPAQLCVLGSLNVDLQANTTRLPQPGETLTAAHFAVLHGGKGANQAVAAARLGAGVRMIGCVGADVFGPQLVQGLASEGVDTTGVRAVGEVHSGTALITVAAQGQNTIVLAAGANREVGDAELAALERVLPGCGMLLLQLEVPLPIVQRAMAVAAAHDVPVLLDPAPFQPLDGTVYKQARWLTPNEVEAGQLVGKPVTSPGEAAEAARELHRRGAAHVVVTLGGTGCYYVTPEEQRFMPGFKVQAVDAVAAGDGFNGALAVALAEGRPVREAIRFAAAAGALAATTPGAQPSLPTRDAVERFLRERPD